MGLRQRVPEGARDPLRRVYSGVERLTSRWRGEPSFIVIGGQRCGTTSMYVSLSEHPQVVRPALDKGTDYYTLHYSRGLDWYRSRFPIRAAANVRTRRYGPPAPFEACTYYLFHPYAIERLARDFPDIKLVAMLRDPVERAFSQYKHELARGFETEPDFLTALQREDERLAGEAERMTDPDYYSFAYRHQAYRRRGQFAEQLRRVYEHYPREQVHVMDSEAFFAEPGEQFGLLTDFLGLAPWRPERFDQHNARPSKSMPAPARAFLENHFRPLDDDLAHLLGRRPYWSPAPSNALEH